MVCHPVRFYQSSLRLERGHCWLLQPDRRRGKLRGGKISGLSFYTGGEKELIEGREGEGRGGISLVFSRVVER